MSKRVRLFPVPADINPENGFSVVPNREGEWLRMGHGNNYTEDISLGPDGELYCTMSGSDVVDDGTWIGPVDSDIISAWVDAGMPNAEAVRAALALYGVLCELAANPIGRRGRSDIPQPQEPPVGAPPSGLPN